MTWKKLKINDLIVKIKKVIIEVKKKKKSIVQKNNLYLSHQKMRIKKIFLGFIYVSLDFDFDGYGGGGGDTVSDK